MTTNTEIYISVDVETSGPFPPDFSMLSLGACVVGQPKVAFYAELRPISDQVIPEAIGVVGKPLSILKGKDATRRV